MLNEQTPDQGQSPDAEPVSDPSGEGEQGQVANERADVSSVGASPATPQRAAAEGTSTVATPTQSSPETEGEGGGADPYEETLEQLEQDYGHAQKKITQQGQELRARDTEIEELRRELAEMRGQLQATPRQPAATSTPATGYGYGNAYGNQQNSGVTALEQQLAEIRQQNQLLTDALLDTNDKIENFQQEQTQSQRESSEKAQFAKATGDDTDRAWELYLSAKEKGDVEAALVLTQIRDAKVKQTETRRKRDSVRQSKVAEGGGGGGGAPGSSTTRTNIPEGLSSRERLRRSLGL
jgi:chromosome segregation ATPase